MRLDKIILIENDMDTTVTEKEKVLKQLQTIPSIGKACSLDLWNIGIRKVSDLAG